MPDWNWLTVLSVVWFEVINVNASCIIYCVMNMKKHFSDLKTLWQRPESILSIMFIQRMKYLT